MATDTLVPATLWTAAGGGGRAGYFPGRVRLAAEPSRRLIARGAIHAPVVLDAQDRVFVVDMTGWIQAFDRQGKALWQRQLEGGASASPAVDAEGQRVFAGTHAGWVYALQNADGSVLWRREIPSKRDARILSDLLYLPVRQSVVLSGWGGQFHELDASSGDLKGAWDAGLSPQSGATADALENLYCLRAVRGEGVVLFCVAADGKDTVLYRQSEPGRGANRTVVAAAPVLDEVRGAVYFIINGDRDSELHAWSTRERRHFWKTSLPRAVVATPAMDPAGKILVADLQGSIRAISHEGAPAFQYASGAEYLLAGPVCSADGNAFAADPLGCLHVIDARGAGRPVFEAARSFQARPAFGRCGDLFLPSLDRTVYVFRNLASG